MSTFILRTGSEVSVAAAPLVAQLRVEAGPLDHRWSVHGTTTEPPAIVRPDRVVLPAITEPTTLRLLPGGRHTRFGPQSVVTVVIGHDRGGADADQVILDDLDLSGLTHRDLVQLVPDGRRIRVIGLRTAADIPLPPVAEIARDAARRILGVPQVAAERTVDLTALIDTSASIRPALDDGAVAAACNVIAGLGTVVAPGRELTAHTPDRLLAQAPPDRFAADAAAALTSVRLTTNFPTHAEGSRHPGSGGCAADAHRVRRIVVTSGVPADRRPDDDDRLLILAPGRSTADGWPGAPEATVLARAALTASPPDDAAISAAVERLLAGWAVDGA